MWKYIIICFLIVFSACSLQSSTEIIEIDPPIIIHDLQQNDGKDIELFIPQPETASKLEVADDTFNYNMNYELRDSILDIEIDWSENVNSIEYFKNLNIRILEELLINNFINPNDAQNLAPNVKTIFKFMEKYPQVFAGGYIVSPLRDDYRISIDELYVREKKVPEQLKIDIQELCMEADSMQLEGELMCWWD